MRIVFMGTPEIAAGVLEAVANSRHETVAVVTQPDKPKGRGNGIVFSAVKETAIKYNIPVLQPVKASSEESVAQIAAYKPDIIVVAAYGQILKTNLLELPRYGCINVHASLLPKYRGASPIQWAVINGEKESGVTIMHMAAGLDTGDMILSRSIKLAADETAGSLHDRLTEIAGPALLEALDEIEKGTAKRIPQNDDEASYVGVFKKEFGELDFTQPAEYLERLIRGLIPWPGAYTFVDGKMLKIWKSSLAEGVDEISGYQPGELIIVADKDIYIGTSNGLLKIEELQMEGKKRMEAEAFLRGSRLPSGIICKKEKE